MCNIDGVDGPLPQGWIDDQEMLSLLDSADALCATHPEMRMDRWVQAAERWAATPEEKAYYRHNAWHLLTTWGDSERLNDYANRLWSGLTSTYYKARWALFIERMLSGTYERESFDRDCWELENRIITQQGADVRSCGN